MESIYNLIPKAAKETPKKTMYRSKYDPKAPLTGSTFGLHGTTVTVGKGINELKKVWLITAKFYFMDFCAKFSPHSKLKY